MSGPLHPKAKELFKAGLYSGLSSFEELEQRIAALDDDKRKGDSFEVFAEAYLATQRKHDAAKVWPHAAVPLEILQRLGLSEQDYGVDGVFQTLLGNHNAYQVKFRSARQPLTWRELSTFMGLADSAQIHSRILITNCDELPSVLNERRGFFCIRGSDLDRLEAEDFRAIEAWLAESAFEAPKKQPQPHQDEALSALLLAFQQLDRVSAIMACGTGKTLVALWTAERLQASKILVLLPSLALLRQTLHEWLRETRVPKLAYLCVCSDPTVKENIDALTTQQSDLDFEVSTDSAIVRQFLDVPFDGTKVIFSTYQSASVVGHAMKPGEMFDFGVFDEAHKTAGREGRNYAFALDDANLPIQKRLFVTATPRHYNPQQRDREGEAQLVFSMDNPAVYGPQAYTLTFGEAARLKIICGYKVIISVITSEMVTNELLSRGEVLVNGDAIRARQVANQIALRDAIQKYGVGKIFTFHKTVKSAASFVAEGSEGIRTHLPDFGSYHVNGEMPTAQRERVMREFRGAARAVMSNARCLTEGVDVPAVDMVAFLSPRRSRVDIVQATGRAMRRSPGKSLGYVLVPLYVELAAGEGVEDAVSRADFDEIWDVLQSLQEQDEVLAEIIRKMREERGRTKGFDDSRFRERVDVLSPAVSLDDLRVSIATLCIERLGAPWDERFGELMAFKAERGDCLVPITWSRNPPLANWVVMQHQLRKRGVLGAERVRRLDSLGFSWNPFETAWEEQFKLLVEFQRLHGHCHVTRDQKDLSRWVSAQRHLRRTGCLDRQQIARLDAIGFEWEPHTSSWEEMFERLVQFHKAHSHCNVPQDWEKDFRLGAWVNKQRRNWKLGRLSVERKNLLDGLGFVWTPIDHAWESRFQELVRFKEKHGHCRVPQRWKDNPKLGLWVAVQRRFKSRNKLPPEVVHRLDNIGFIWDPHQAAWEEMFGELVAFHRANGHSNVPYKYPRNRDLAHWVHRQRQGKKTGTLSGEQIQQLQKLDFVWDVREAAWEKWFTILSEFQRVNGHCRVPQRWKENPQLTSWVVVQRQNRKKGLLDTQQIARLDAIGVEWTPNASAWDEMFARLVQFHKTHSHCNVPQDWGKDLRLGTWVAKQRDNWKRNRLSAERKTLLDGLGFVWTPIDTAWESKFQELVRFKERHGHCRVPSEWKENPKLGSWVKVLRRSRRNGSLDTRNIARLDTIGFSWKGKQ